VQVDSIRPTLKAPGIKRLKLRHDTRLSNVAFKFDLRRYTAAETHPDRCQVVVNIQKAFHLPRRATGRAVQVAPVKSTLKAPVSKRLKLNSD
jgi:hypothetical protein